MEQPTLKNEFIVYTSNGCMQCKFLKDELNRRGIEFEEINVSEDDSARDYLKNMGIMSAPVLMDFEEIVFTGFRPDRLDELGV